MRDAIVKQEFDSGIFGVPFYRIMNLDLEAVQSDLDNLSEICPLIVDAKVTTPNREWELFLQVNGFRKVCVQVELEKEVSGVLNADEVLVEATPGITEEELGDHVRNFVFDRFSLDPFIPQDKRNFLYHTWIRNSFSNPAILVAHIGAEFCTFKIRENLLFIDLISVITKGKNIGSRLLAAVNNYAFSNSLPLVRVITETENWNAVRFYMANGYRISRFISCYHLTRFQSAVPQN